MSSFFESFCLIYLFPYNHGLIVTMRQPDASCLCQDHSYIVRVDLVHPYELIWQVSRY